MKWLKKLDNPVLLVLEGFVAGALLFFATNPGAADSHAASAPSAPTVRAASR